MKGKTKTMVKRREGKLVPVMSRMEDRKSLGTRDRVIWW